MHATILCENRSKIVISRSKNKKIHRPKVCQNLKERTDADNDFIRNIKTSDKTRVYGYDIETKQQSSQLKTVIFCKIELDPKRYE